MTETQGGLSIVLTTLPSQEDAQNIAETLVKERLVACASFLDGVFSAYFWKDNLEKALEVILWLKVPDKTLTAAKERLQALHPYEVPEILTLRTLDVNQAYLTWAIKETRQE